MSDSRSLVRGFAQLSVVEVVVRVLTVAGLVAIARLLGPTALGQFAVAQAVLMYAAAISDAGLKTLAQREMVRDPAQARSWASSTVAVQVAAATLMGGLVAASGPLLPFDVGTQRVLVVLAPLLLAQALNVQFVLQTFERFGYLAIARLTTQLAITGGTIAMLVSGQSILWVAMAMWGGTLVGDLVAYLLVRRMGETALGTVSRAGVLRLLRNASPFVGLTFLSLIVQNADVVVIGVALGANDAGQYSAALRVVVILIGFSALVISVTLSEMVRLASDAPHQLGTFLARTLRPLCQLGYAASALLIVAPHQLLSITFGPEFAEAGAALRILALAVPLGFCNSVLSQALIAGNAQRAFVAVAGVTATFCLTSLMVLVPRDGILAAAGIMVAAEIISLIGLSFVICRRWHSLPIIELIRQSTWLGFPLLALVFVGSMTNFFPATLACWIIATAVVDAMTGFTLCRAALAIAGQRNRTAPEGSGP